MTSESPALNVLGRISHLVRWLMVLSWASASREAREKDKASNWYHKAVDWMERTNLKMRNSAASAPRRRICWA
jgi:hypothetical protein